MIMESPQNPMALLKRPEEVNPRLSDSRVEGAGARFGHRVEGLN